MEKSPHKKTKVNIKILPWIDSIDYKGSRLAAVTHSTYPFAITEIITFDKIFYKR